MTEAAHGHNSPSPIETISDVSPGRNRRPTLSLIMIVRDEEENIPAVLGPMQGKFDEIIVVDTGSVDRTVELAREHGATVHFFEWIHNFSAARNESIRHATGDWLFWLDADDRMAANEVDRLRALIALHPEGDVAYYCHLRSLGSSWTSEQNLLQVRLFPNLPGVAFVGEVHERLTESLRDRGVRIEPSSVEIVHVGYMDADVLPEKYARNLDIMNRMLEENPRELQTRYQLIMQLAAMGRVDETLEQLSTLGEHVAEVSSDVDKIYRYLLLKGIVHRNFGDPDAAREAYEEVIATFPTMGVTHYLIATILYEEGKWEEMRAHLLKAEYHGISIDAVPIPLARVLFDMSAMMAMYYRRGSQWILAAQEFRKALALQEEYLPYYHEMANCYVKAGAHDRAVSALTTAIRVHDTAVDRIANGRSPERLTAGTAATGTVSELSPEARTECLAALYRGLAQTLMTLDRRAAAQAAIEEGLRRIPESAGLMACYVDWLLRARRVDGALKWTEKLIEAGDGSAASYEGVINLYLQHGASKEAAALLRRFWQAHPSKWDAALVCLLSSLQAGDTAFADDTTADIGQRLVELGVGGDDWPRTLAADHPLFAHFTSAVEWLRPDEVPDDDVVAYAEKLAAIASAMHQLVQGRT
jgi:glycosyltransferase involved in cell wall biosynthesis